MTLTQPFHAHVPSRSDGAHCSPRPVRSSVVVPFRMLAGAVAALALATGATLLMGAPATAHDSIVGTSPEDGAVLDAAPARVAVTLSDVPQAIAPRMIVTDEAGTIVLDEEPVITDRSAAADLPALENGTYQVAWRVVSSDGHPIQGTYSFTVAAPVASEPGSDPAVTPSAPDAPVSGATDASTDGSDPDETVTTAGPDSETDAKTDPATDVADEGSSSTALVAGSMIAVVAVALAGLVLVRRRRSLKDES